MEDLIKRAVPYVDDIFAVRVDVKIESIYCNDGLFRNGYKWVLDFEEFCEVALEKLSISKIQGKLIEGAWVDMVCTGEFGEKTFSGTSKIEAISKAVLFFLQPKEEKKHVVLDDKTLKIVDKIEAAYYFYEDKEVVAFYDDGTTAEVEDDFDISTCTVYGVVSDA